MSSSTYESPANGEDGADLGVLDGTSTTFLFLLSLSATVAVVVLAHAAVELLTGL